MDDGREVIDSLLAEKPGLESDLEALLDADEDGPWTFDEIPLDSGTFGEVVSRGIAEEHDDGYRLTDPDAVRAALDGETIEPDPEETDDSSTFSLPDIDRRAVLALAGALAFVAVIRVVFMWGSVFRGEHIVLAGNDPYYYRYWVDTLLASGLHSFDLNSLTRLPADVANSDVLLIVLLWWGASLLGSGQTASGLVVALYPVIAAIITGGILYLLATVITQDRRVGVATLLTLAVIPANAYRSALGYGDHHALDFLWLGIVALMLVIVVADERSRDWPGWLKPVGTVGLGIGIAAQSMSWRGGPILLFPIVLFVILRAVDNVRSDRPVIKADRWLISGLVLGGLVPVFSHFVLGWLEMYRVIAPVLVAVGAMGVTLIAYGWNRTGYSARLLASTLVVSSGGIITSMWAAIPAIQPPVLQFRNFLELSSGIAETQSIFAGGLGSIAGPLLFFGFFFFLAVPFLGIATWRVYQSSHPGWLVLVVFSWFLLLMTIIQVRFAGELSLFVALFAGVGLVRLAEWVDISRPMDENGMRKLQIPDARSLLLLTVLFLLVGGLGVVQAGVKMNQVSVDSDTYQTSQWIADYTEEQGMNQTESYVFSPWGENRMYNYFSNGESQSYSFALNNYENFTRDASPIRWYQRLRPHVGFVVVNKAQNAPKSESIHGQLLDQLGGKISGKNELQNYRLSYVSPNHQTAAFELVEGASITGIAPSNSPVEIQTNVDLVNSEPTYRKSVQPAKSNWYNVVITQPGTYSIGDENITVDRGEIRKGSVMKTVQTNGSSYWSFDIGEEAIAYDTFSANHGEIHNASRVNSGHQGDGLQFSPDRAGFVEAKLNSSPERFTLSLWVNPSSLNTSSDNDYRYLLRSGERNILILEETGEISYRLPAHASDNFRAGRVETGNWNHVLVTYNGSYRSVYINGTLAGSDRIGERDLDWGPNLQIGGSKRGVHTFDGTIDGVRMYNYELNESRIQSLASG